MRNIKLPSKPFKGLKIFCRICRGKVKGCNHESKDLVYRLIVHIPNSGGKQITKNLSAENYEDAVVESIEFRRHLENSNYSRIDDSIEELSTDEDYSLAHAIIKYNQYLRGEIGYSHLKKNLSKDYINEVLRYCKLFAKEVKKRANIEKVRITEVSKGDVSKFYVALETKYSPKTFNKCFTALKGFFDFLINIEDVNMKNPFAHYTPKAIPQNEIEILTKKEFESILDAIEYFDSNVKLGGRGEVKNMYFPWLRDAFRLFLLTGARREEVFKLKWSDIFVSENGLKFFMFDNLKVERIKKIGNVPKKYVPINADLEELLVEMGLNQQTNPDDYILCPDRKCTSKSLMDRVSKSFTHYKFGAGIEKNVSLKNLRKTYITWVNQSMGGQTGILTSHSTNEVLEKFYLDPKVLSAIELGVLKIKVFGDDEL
jgi:integrase